MSFVTTAVVMGEAKLGAPSKIQMEDSRGQALRKVPHCEVYGTRCAEVDIYWGAFNYVGVEEIWNRVMEWEFWVNKLNVGMLGSCHDGNLEIAIFGNRQEMSRKYEL